MTTNATSRLVLAAAGPSSRPPRELPLPSPDSRRRVHRLTARILALVVCLFAAAAPSSAEPITGSVDGCVTSLPGGEATWTYTEHFQFVAFWDPVAGCDPTIAIPIVLHEWLENFDGTGGLKTITRLDWFPTCGRIQFDAHKYIAPNVLDPFGLVSLVFNTGVNCAPSLTGGTNGSITGGDDGSTPSPVPEPATMVLVGAGLLWVSARARRRAPRS